MIIQNVEVNACTPQTIVIGRRTTYDTLQVVFDLSYLAETYGSGAAVLVVKRSQDTTAYPATITQDGNTLTWTISEADTYYVGAGECELMWYVNNGLAKTIIYPVVVMRDILQTAEEPPDAYENWVESLTALGAGTQQHALDAAQSATDAEAAQTAAEAAADRAEDALEEFTTPTASATSLAPEAQATAAYSSGHFTFGIPRGAQGATGATPDFEIGTVETLEPDQPATATITGTPENPVLNLGIPKGEKGEGGGGAVTSVAGKTGAVTLDAGDAAFSDSATYAAGTVGAALSAQKNAISQNTEAISELDDSVLSEFGISLESGSFDSDTGAKITNGARIRSVDFVKNINGVITAKTNTGQQLGILLYAWDGNNYVGFWSGTSFVKSGSQYLTEINLSEFINNFPNYTYKIVMQYENASNVNAVQTNANSLRALTEHTAFEVENISSKVGNVQLIDMESGTFDSSTGANKTDGARIRSKKYITNESSVIEAHSVSGEELSILLYAWDNNDNYIGFWGGASFVKSGSQYLYVIDLDWFTSNYPAYKYKCVIATTSASNTIVEQRSKDGLEYRVEILEENADILPTDITTSPDKNMCLCGIKTKIADNCIPFHEGFLFHSFKTADRNKMWYGSNLNNMKMIGSFPTDPRQLRFAISPTDGRVIATNRDTRSGIWIWNKETTVLLNTFSINPQGWLYNSGVEFIVDDHGVEHCVFAEYNGNPSSPMLFNVWRGTYPYTSASNWEVVMTQNYPTIMHFHMVRRDPWTNILYLASGDENAQCKWWYSLDYGETWEVLTTGETSGYPNQVCRTINFVFTEDWIYWATDHGTNHCLNKVSRGSGGLIDVSSRVKLCDLPDGYATNFLCYVETPNGLFMYDRVDIGYSSQYGDPVTMKFYDLTDNTLKDIATLKLVDETWGGSRGKCYVYATNSKQPMPAMGFSPDTPCLFDLICDDLSAIGTIAYEVGAKTVRTIDLTN